MLDFRVETFLTVCKYMNYTKAAEELALTQPAVSQHVRYLENHYNCRLFDYQNKRLSLTKQGEYLKQAFERLALEEMRLSNTIPDIRGRRKIRIGSTRTIAGYELPERLAEYIRKNPDTDVCVVVDDTKRLLEKLDRGELDIAFCEGLFNKQEYRWSVMKQETINGYVAYHEEVGRIDSIEQLFDRRLIIREKGSGTREIFEQHLEKLGYPVQAFVNSCVIDEPHLILEMVLSGLGISFMYDCMAKNYVEEKKLKMLEIPGFPVEHEFCVIWKPSGIESIEQWNPLF